MVRISLLLGLLAALALPALAAAADKTDFATEKYFLIGSSLADANKLLADEKRWEIGLRMDTPSVSRISCRYNSELIYMVEFYQGQCYSIEKRMVIAAAEVEPLFQRFKELYGESPESTQDKDQTLYYAHWYTKERETELTIYEHQDGNFMAMLEDYLPEIRGEAQSVMEQELQSQPTEIDPITGKPRIIPQDQAGQDAGASGQEEAEGQQPQPEQDKDQKEPSKEKDKGKEKDKPEDPPGDPVDWDDI